MMIDVKIIQIDSEFAIVQELDMGNHLEVVLKFDSADLLESFLLNLTVAKDDYWKRKGVK